MRLLAIYDPNAMSSPFFSLQKIQGFHNLLLEPLNILGCSKNTKTDVSKPSLQWHSARLLRCLIVTFGHWPVLSQTECLMAINSTSQMTDCHRTGLSQNGVSYRPVGHWLSMARSVSQRFKTQCLMPLTKRIINE